MCKKASVITQRFPSCTHSVFDIQCNQGNLYILPACMFPWNCNHDLAIADAMFSQESNI